MVRPIRLMHEGEEVRETNLADRKGTLFATSVFFKFRRSRDDPDAWPVDDRMELSSISVRKAIDFVSYAKNPPARKISHSGRRRRGCRYG